MLFTLLFFFLPAAQVRYDFYIPPVLVDGSRSPHGLPRAFPIPRQPITPFPRVGKVLSPDRASEVPRQHHRGAKQATPPTHVDASKMLTIYGENFTKGDALGVWFGADPAPYVEIRCSEVVGCLPPSPPSPMLTGAGAPQQRRPVFLVRGDGVIFPSSASYV
jgi:recombining binding protein suppressor of hairless